MKQKYKKFVFRQLKKIIFPNYKKLFSFEKVVFFKRQNFFGKV